MNEQRQRDSCACVRACVRACGKIDKQSDACTDRPNGRLSFLPVSLFLPFFVSSFLYYVLILFCLLFCFQQNGVITKSVTLATVSSPISPEVEVKGFPSVSRLKVRLCHQFA